MSKGPRVGDIGTEIILHITDNGEPVNLGGASAAIEIIQPGEQAPAVYAAMIEEATVKYTGKPSDDLWPAIGDYVVRGVVEWPEPNRRRFMTENIVVRVR